MSPRTFRIASSIAASILMIVGLVSMAVPATAGKGARKVTLKSIKPMKCADDVGKKPCGKGITKIATELQEWVTKYLRDAAWTCTPGKNPEPLSVTIYWDHDEGWPEIEGGDKALEGFPACIREELIPSTVEALPPIHYGVKATDPSVHMRYYLKISVVLAE